MVLFLDPVLTTVYAATFLCQTKLDWMATSTLSGTALVQSWSNQPESSKAPLWGSWNNKDTPTRIISVLYLSVEEQIPQTGWHWQLGYHDTLRKYFCTVLSAAKAVSTENLPKKRILLSWAMLHNPESSCIVHTLRSSLKVRWATAGRLAALDGKCPCNHGRTENQREGSVVWEREVAADLIPH
ncbi:hypothetical protein GRJ2_002144900 [Grus japonensis]|uniref:Uncharacterized protein n=1 Tax=Grus japonensis TaxID=30415 RepID=A0ABC9XGI0_GRUJA